MKLAPYWDFVSALYLLLGFLFYIIKNNEYLRKKGILNVKYSMTKDSQNRSR